MLKKGDEEETEKIKGDYAAIFRYIHDELLSFKKVNLSVQFFKKFIFKEPTSQKRDLGNRLLDLFLMMGRNCFFI